MGLSTYVDVMGLSMYVRTTICDQICKKIPFQYTGKQNAVIVDSLKVTFCAKRKPNNIAIASCVENCRRLYVTIKML